MYAQSSLLLCNTGQSRRRVNLKLVSLLIPSQLAEKGFTLLDLKAAAKGWLRTSLNILTGGVTEVHSSVNWRDENVNLRLLLTFNSASRKPLRKQLSSTVAEKVAFELSCASDFLDNLSFGIRGIYWNFLHNPTQHFIPIK